mgnify:CR=1 FL=1
MARKENQRQKKQHYFPLRNPDNPYAIKLIPLDSEEQHREIYRNINRKRKQEQRAGRCFSTKKDLWMCSADCDVCPFHKDDGHLSLDMVSENSNGDGSSLLDYLQDATNLEEEIETAELETAVWFVISALPQEDRDIIQLYIAGLTEREIAEKVGCSQKKVNYRKKAIFQILIERLQDWF